MTRAEWLASLQTFDKVWIPPDKTGPGRVVEVVVMRDGSVRALGTCGGRDLRQPFRNGICIQPLPEAPWGRCPSCGKVRGRLDHLSDGRCLACRHVPRACPAGCRTQEEHDAEVRAQRQRCGLAPSDADPVH